MKNVKREDELLVAEAVVEAAGVTCIALPCETLEESMSLPKVISYNGVVCGRTLWNPEMKRQHYSSDAKVVKSEQAAFKELQSVRGKIAHAHRLLKKLTHEPKVTPEVLHAYEDLQAVGVLLGMWDGENFRDIRKEDVGKALFYAFGRNWPVSEFIGRIFPEDVGKRVFKVKCGEDDYILQVENDQQRAKRLKKGKS